MPSAALVSCLCVTRARVPLLRRAVACFQRQTYEPRELVVLFETDDHASLDYLGTLQDSRVRPIAVPALPRLSLGRLRNRSVEAGRGRYLAQWDDDDWHAPTRLQEQIATLQRSGRPACALRRWTLYDALSGRAFISGPRAWEGSLVAQRSAMTAYADLARGEDTAVVERLGRRRELVLLDRPQLYVYTYHGGNTWTQAHWQRRLLPRAEPLAPEEATRIARLLQSG